MYIYSNFLGDVFLRIFSVTVRLRVTKVVCVQFVGLLCGNVPLRQLKASMKLCVEVLHTDVAAAQENRVDDTFTDLRSF